MLPIEIHNRGRGPELKGTRITVYDIVPYRLAGMTPEQITEVFALDYITPAHIAALFEYMDAHHDAVMARHWKIEKRNAQGNPPEVEEKLARTAARREQLLNELRRRAEAAASAAGG